MPIKNWSDGDYVYGTDMDLITTSLVMRFPDAATRTSTLVGDLTPVPGMMSCLLDSQTWWTYVVVNPSTGTPVSTGGTGFWVPLPGTSMVNAFASATQTLGVSGNTFVLACQQASRNLNAWYSTSTYRFNPKVPGWFQLSAGVTFALNGTGAREIWLRQNGNDLTGTGQYNSAPGSGGATSMISRTASVRFNGNTDYVDVAIMQSSGGTLDTYVALPQIASNFNATYLGVA